MMGPGSTAGFRAVLVAAAESLWGDYALTGELLCSPGSSLPGFEPPIMVIAMMGAAIVMLLRRKNV